MTETYISFNGGAYSNRSLVAAAQRCVNLYVEPTNRESGEPYLYTHYGTPGTTLLRTASTSICRCAYQASDGTLWMVYGQVLYYVDTDNLFTAIGTMTPGSITDIVPRSTPVSIADNGVNLLICDGSIDGWTVNLANRNNFTRIDAATVTQSGWYGSPRIVEQDNFFIASQPNTPNFYVSGLLATTFDPLDFATKAYQADNIVGIASVQRNLWILGELTYEVWSTATTTSITQTFPYEPLPGAVGNWGCAALGSIATTNNQVFWLSKDRSGRGMIYQGQSTQAKRVSTHAIEYAISKYPVISDATSYCYQQDGHVCYVINFPSANSFRGATWCYDSTEDEWHERMTIFRNTADVREWNGIEYRHRLQCATEWNGMVVGGDWENSNFYQLDLDTYTDCGQPIVRIRSGPHEIDMQGNDRIDYKQLQVNMQVGTESTETSVPAFNFLNCSFTAANGTLLQNYSNSDDTGATFTTEVGNTTNVIITTNTMVGQTVGLAEYEASGTPTTADYVVELDIGLTNFNSPRPPEGSEIHVTGRADSAGLGYLAGIYATSTETRMVFRIGNFFFSSVSVGDLTSGQYKLYLSMIGSSITVAIYRTSDGYWLRESNSWGPSYSIIYGIDDTFYTQPGKVVVGGVWT